MRGETVVTVTRLITLAGSRVARCQRLEGRPGKLPLSGRQEMRDLVGMRLRPEEDALARLLPYQGLDSKDTSEDFGGEWWTPSSLRGVRGQLDWRDSVSAVPPCNNLRIDYP